MYKQQLDIQHSNHVNSCFFIVLVAEIRKVELTYRGNFDVSKVTDFYLPSHTLEVGSYLVVFSGTETPFCGPSPLFMHDYVRMDILPRLITAVISKKTYICTKTIRIT